MLYFFHSGLLLRLDCWGERVKSARQVSGIAVIQMGHGEDQGKDDDNGEKWRGLVRMLEVESVGYPGESGEES